MQLLIIFPDSVGHVDPGENDLQAAFRETEEEAGLKEEDLAVVEGFESVLKVHYVHFPYNIENTRFSNILLVLALECKPMIIVSKILMFSLYLKHLLLHHLHILPKLL